MASGPYFLTLEKALNDYFETGTWYCMLLTGYTENQDTQQFRSDIVANEVAPTGNYTTGGNPSGTPTVVFNAGTNLYTVTFPQVTWASATISATHAAWYKELGADSVDELAYVNNFGSTVSSTNDTYTVPACDFQLNFPD